MKRIRKAALLAYLLVVVVVMLLYSHPVVAESGIRFQINVNVSADPAIKTLINSYLNREFRALGDVELVDTNSDWSMSIICVQVESLSGPQSQVLLSVVITELYPNAAIVSMLPAESKQLGNEITSNLYLARDHWVRSGSQENLQQICSKIIADFDILYLEKERQRWKDVQNIMQQKKTSK
ncbi:MAG TPA: hypothetical protein VMW42_12885 [Desulfatiglandales bacterium]|nr:hypothetical protein [Desulfatiglandales bacterium]